MADQGDLFGADHSNSSDCSYRLNNVQAELTLWPHFIDERETPLIFDRLISELQWEQSNIQVYGTTVPIPRLNAWYADPGCEYAYSGTQLQRLDWHPLLLEIKQSVEQKTQQKFNSVLVNLYRNGQDSVSWHSDDEPELGHNPVIASVSLGTSRRFLLKHRTRKDLSVIDLRLTDGSLLVMSGETQHFWYHCVPKSRAVDTARVNLTFRTVY